MMKIIVSAHHTNVELPYALCNCDYKDSYIFKWKSFKVSFDFNFVTLQNHLNNVHPLSSLKFGLWL